MRNLRILILLLKADVDNLNRTFNALQFDYGVQNIDIAGVIGEYTLSLEERDLPNIAPNKLPEVVFDYVIVAGEPESGATRKNLADKLGLRSEQLIFDFELCNGTFSFPKVCLVVIFNHRFDRNLPLLRKIYGARFSAIRFLMPFYDGADVDVIPVYESSHQFCGYLIQAYERLKDIPCTHFLFIGDDLIINPDFDETNFVARTNMHGKKFLTTEIVPLNSTDKFRWYWSACSSKPFYNPVTSWRGSLYSYDEALAKFNEFFGAKYPETYGADFFGDPNLPGGNILGQWNNAEEFSSMVNLFKMLNENTFKIPYPMAMGYSDIFCVERGSLFEFSRLCGIFSAMKVFVEIAIPTAAVFTYKRDDVTFFPANSIQVFWGTDRVAFENRFGKDFNRLYNEWDAQIAYVHPVKLSIWKMD